LSQVGRIFSRVAALPSGTVTFLLTDIEASTRQWEMDAAAMDAALARHDRVLRSAVETHGGCLVKSTGDGMLAVFDRAAAALNAAVDAQLALGSDGLPAARMAVHTGEAFERDGDYFGPALNRAARLMAIGHGGQVLVSQATEYLITDFELRDPGEHRLRDLGEHRLRDLSRPERVFQLCHRSLPGSFPALRSLESYPTNLPAQITGFVGRDRDMREAEEALGQCRALTLTGVGGIGKTRLALQVAADVLTVFPDGVFMVELGGVSDAAAVDASVAAALLVQQQPGQTITASLLSFLGNKHLLLLLDNCEHLLEPLAQLVSRILGVAPEVRVLATSREALRIDGEQVMTVPSLAVPDESAALEELGTTDAVRLFVDRAHATRSEFMLTDENAAAVTQLCRRLDGVPLAIELAAARVRSMAPNEIAERLDQRFRLLTSGTRTAASRHQTLRRAIDWSYDALEVVEQTLLGRLAVCLGGFDLTAAEAIGAGGAIDALDVDDALGRLVDKSLVLATDRGGVTRYKMLETIREYALERLDATGETSQVRMRHAVHYTDFAERAGSGLKGPQERAWLGRVEDELDNLRAAVMWSLASGDTHLACACVRALGLQGLRIEPVVSAWAESIIECAAAHDDPAYPAALAVAGYAKMGEGRPDDATQLCNAALARLDEAPPAVACRVLSCASATQPYIGRNPQEHARQWVRAAEAASDNYETALALAMVAIGQNMNSDPVGHDTAEESLRMARACGSPSAIAYCLFTTALVDAPDDPSRALDLLDDSIRSAEAAANTFAAINSAGIRNALLFQSGQYEAAARACLGEAQRAFQYGRIDRQAPMLGQLAACLAARGTPEPAAVIDGWSHTILGSDAISAGALYTEPFEWLAQLPEVLGADRYATLRTSGAAMTAAQILDYAQQHTTPPGALE
jgi:predicted ATPase/class 3 adenylate cyclase